MEIILKDIPDLPQYQINNKGTFIVGRKPDVLKITFDNGIVHYYNGENEVVAALNISRNTINRIKNDAETNLFGISSIEVVDTIPQNHINPTIEIKSPIKQVLIEYWKKPNEVYENCREADRALGLPIGTVQRWANRNWDRVSSGKATKLGIKRIVKI